MFPAAATETVSSGFRVSTTSCGERDRDSRLANEITPAGAACVRASSTTPFPRTRRVTSPSAQPVPATVNLVTADFGGGAFRNVIVRSVHGFLAIVRTATPRP